MYNSTLIHMTDTNMIATIVAYIFCGIALIVFVARIRFTFHIGAPELPDDDIEGDDVARTVAAMPPPPQPHTVWPDATQIELFLRLQSALNEIQDYADSGSDRSGLAEQVAVLGTVDLCAVIASPEAVTAYAAAVESMQMAVCAVTTAIVASRAKRIATALLWSTMWRGGVDRRTALEPRHNGDDEETVAIDAGAVARAVAAATKPKPAGVA